MPQIQLWPATRDDAQHIINTITAETLDLQTCTICGDSFHSPKSGNGRRRSFCSKECYYQHAEKNPGRRRWLQTDKAKVVAKRKVAKYARSEHGRLRYEQRQRWQRLVVNLDPSQRPQPKPNLNPWPTCTTPDCHNIHKSRNGGYCAYCRYQNKIAGRPNTWRNAGKPCVTCGKELSRYQRKTCSYSCERERRRTCPKWKATIRKHRAVRRARKRAAYVESVDVMQLLKWQDGRCYHCNCKIRLDVEVPHPKSLTLDHLVPLALGGEHSYANTAASCFNCNCAVKGIKPINEQLKLV